MIFYYNKMPVFLRYHIPLTQAVSTAQPLKSAVAYIRKANKPGHCVNKLNTKTK